MLTDKTRYRVGFRKRLILQVQYTAKHFTYPDECRTSLAWRDARFEDLSELP